MATVVRLTPEQIERLFEEAEQMELAFKDVHADLVEADIPKPALNRFAALHNRFTSAISYLRRQRELGEG